MASKKKPNSELVAICKLEFYRKQKNWRYCPPEHRGKDNKRRTKTSNVKLNQTYNIVRAPETQEPSPPETPDTEERHILDEAFVDTETGTESDEQVQREEQDVNAPVTGADEPSSQLEPPGFPYSPKWSIERWAKRSRFWNPEPAPAPDPTCPTHDPTRPTHELTCPTSASKMPALYPTRPNYDPTVPQRAHLSEDANCPIFDNNYNKIQQDVYYSNHYLNLHTETGYHVNYPAQSCDIKYQEPFDPKYGVSMVYYNSNMHHQDFDVPQSGANLDVGKECEWHGDDWERCAGEGAGWSDLDWLQEAAAVGAGGEDALDGDWHLLDLSEVSVSDSLPSVASSEFIRGAALAPHSTQTDLLLGSEPAALPTSVLTAAVARHSAALRTLLAEAQRRRQMPAPPPSPERAPPPHSLDEVPVRDPGPARPPASSAATDRIVAGSRPAPTLRGHTDTAGQAGLAGHTGSKEHAGITGHTGSAGQADGGRGRGRLKVGIRMGRPYRL